MSPPFRLEGPGIVLREFGPDDVDVTAAIVGDHHVTHWLAFDEQDRESAASTVAAAMDSALVRPRTEYLLVIAEPGDETMIGFVRLALGGVKAAKLGYAIHADHWGRGHATAAARLVLGHAFTELGLHRVTAAIGPVNVRSVGVVERLGFRLEGRLRDHVFTNGAWRDSLLFSVLAHEWSGA
ncbi:GNAT family N-acetyltransferase [Kineosporia succinea]|uniref:RimJ/RimL family protein N-acetyltransferase n=1 Tax=Kineosporia succinea TaxID=84632 RepID=A0ABT9P7K5_9ACTN|nr:GNAT family protein [Kineosporia succinea]MDP9828678.1 RimJ/RimL family protein N-acetyltransferase [Kineosporia succinea]